MKILSFSSIWCWGLLICLCLCTCVSAERNQNPHNADIEDNEFAEFEEFDDDDDQLSSVKKGTPNRAQDQSETSTEQSTSPKSATPQQDVNDDEGVVEDDDDDDDDDPENEFNHFTDKEEFEGFEAGKSAKSKQDSGEIKITKVPAHLRTNWDGFYMEWLMIFGLLIYFINFIAGRNKNQKLANAWLAEHRQILEQNFHLIGDDGKAAETESCGFVKESENVYTLWCSGRTCCEGMLVELSFIKRQDLIHVMSQLAKQASDQIIIKVYMNSEDMDSFVCALIKKKTAAKIAKNLTDLSTLCPEKKNPEKYGIPQSFVMFNELGEVPSSLFDSKLTTILNKYEDQIDYIHFSDRYSGQKLMDDQPVKQTDIKKVLIFAFNVPGRGNSTPEGMEAMKPLLQLVFYMMDKVKRFRLSKEAKQKAEKSRVKLEEAFLKTTHQQRIEAAQQRKEDKRRAEKEKIMNEDDPDKQRKWEEREHRRELKKRAPKMKQLKVKAL
ncbi:hypothetical protein CHUAL_010338 [Chamberlinius hualienensis]